MPLILIPFATSKRASASFAYDYHLFALQLTNIFRYSQTINILILYFEDN